MPNEFTFEIRKHLGTLAVRNNGWSKELNIVCWNDQSVPKFDIRAWDRNHTHMSRGITLYADEMRQLVSLYLAYQNQKTVDEAKADQEADRMEYLEYRKKTEQYRTVSAAAETAADAPDGRTAPDAGAPDRKAAADEPFSSMPEDPAEVSEESVPGSETDEYAQDVSSDVPLQVNQDSGADAACAAF
ncbi:MAG: PC4/YdbC family ssDNA-binding protein [Clostridiales bacterium]|uniref:YdbC family protein n=1 Tax=Hornefia butyriciproducens TaxID=2652293 RepID=UPI002A912BDF|nr:hypothetical protein [Hornefia butyriciproducens]MCI7679133.1 PC4/YdbC family ssDNA-binding protein [Clostridiales bacterium]MDY5462877.1 hypothetical protein [Hornefia butyriciproducens]